MECDCLVVLCQTGCRNDNWMSVGWIRAWKPRSVCSFVTPLICLTFVEQMITVHLPSTGQNGKAVALNIAPAAVLSPSLPFFYGLRHHDLYNYTDLPHTDRPWRDGRLSWLADAILQSGVDIVLVQATLVAHHIYYITPVFCFFCISNCNCVLEHCNRNCVLVILSC